ncbi:MAG: hypothetical protein Q8N84_01955 [bacterium]|nr:hypothetical protein [bacterium]
MNDQIEEILTYLTKRNDYVIWAGFCVFAHLGIRPSADIDIYVDKAETKEEMSQYFQNKGWVKQPHKEVGFGWDWDNLEKLETTFDIVYSPDSAKLLLRDAVEIGVLGHKARFLSREWLFLTKLGQLSWLDRKEEKRKRDLETIDKLRKLINPEILNRLASSLPISYWQAGQI